MAFGINRRELQIWKQQVEQDQIAFLTHYWIDARFPGCHSVTKAGCRNMGKLISWGKQYGLNPAWIDDRSNYPHYDLVGNRQIHILKEEGMWDHIRRFKLEEKE